MAVYKLTKIKEYDAHGGPAKETPGEDGHSKTPTQSGRFVINSVGKHVSYGKYAYWSGVAWGTPVRLIGDTVMVKHDGRWIQLSKVNKQWGEFREQKLITHAVKQAHHQISGMYTVPSAWIFNDFGHTSVKYFKDTNHNWRMDGKEKILGDFIHTTPGDEYDTSLKRPVRLGESHGCIHVKPLEIDTMIGNGYLKKGNTVEVHPYTDKAIASNLVRTIAQPLYEVHFYPGIYKIAIYRVTQ
ncbi:hypothetical protein PBAL39_16536 [Pedobacter sp. BAL39]|uniref:hypothetical protein n=1 Tax=Pedobacter sp. BAL39 TaxID=391596 RepID=UPI0001559F7C|nr:hypothetical protein [Pedobacter sp. BAL39]EDM35107.1 hypothetical protein PBAL39_16536 [Pedobacter sp. BAL39]